ncbi:MAG: hypothetical protein NVS3B26_18370 [Mycobacteriales bacterium]
MATLVRTAPGTTRAAAAVVVPVGPQLTVSAGNIADSCGLGMALTLTALMSWRLYLAV